MPRRCLLLCATFLFSACAPIVIPPAIGPAELQRYSDAATNTAAADRALATQDAHQAAQATATGQSARETATAASQGTLGALGAHQTEVALSLTQGAGLADATDASASRTQAARETWAWATPTAAALATGAAIQGREQARHDAWAAWSAEFWRTVQVMGIVLGAAWALAWIVTVAIDRVWRAHVLRQAAQARIVQETFRVIAPAHYAQLTPGAGYTVDLLPAPLDAPAVIVENADYRLDREQAWQQAVRLFTWHGDRYGFGLREMLAAGVVSDPGWRILRRLLVDAGILAERALPGRRGRATAWADDWSYARLADALAHGGLALEFPAADPPQVAAAVPTVVSLQ